MTLLTIILCVLLPPVAVFMKTGLNGTFLLNVVLSILGWVPGVIHALYVNSRWPISDILESDLLYRIFTIE